MEIVARTPRPYHRGLLINTSRILYEYPEMCDHNEFVPELLYYYIPTSSNSQYNFMNSITKLNVEIKNTLTLVKIIPREEEEY